MTTGAPTEGTATGTMTQGTHCRIIVLGSTGSIGTQTLDVVEHLNALHDAGQWPVKYRIVGLAAATRSELVRKQAERFGVRHTALARTDRADDTTFTGPDSAEKLIREIDCDLVIAAITGAAGLRPTLAAVQLGRDVALANKETLVAAGALIVPEAQRAGARLLPIDSEHSALWQCLAGATGAATALPLTPDSLPTVSRLILTASGGPFRTWTREQIESATPAQALKHPVWNMGPKVTVDCASLTNKGLEVIEAHWLFGLPASRLDVVIHPQSIIHSLVEFTDGSTIAQLGSPDMRIPIQYALTHAHHPGRAPGAARRLDWRELRTLEFEPPDHDRFPALRLACQTIEIGGTAGATFNAANEAAVAAFLNNQIPFGRISTLVHDAVERLGASPIRTLDDVLQADAAARRAVADQLRT